MIDRTDTQLKEHPTMFTRGSISRHVTLRLVPVLFVLFLLDFVSTWYISTHAIGLQWNLFELLLLLIVGQSVIVLGFGLAVYFGVRSGLRSLHDLSRHISERNAEALQAIPLDHIATELVPVVVRINDLLQKSEQSVLAQKRFIANAAHQLRTPLSGLRLESELMLSKPDLPPEIQMRVQRIHHAANRMIRLGEQLLALAKVDTSLHPQHSFKSIDLAELVQQVGSEWYLKAKQQHIELGFEAPDLAVMIDGDSILLEELISNLIDNALKYAQGAKHISLIIKQNPPALYVEDDGIGIDAEQQSLVFEAFHRAPTSPSGMGTGLGLSIVREIAKVHGAGWSILSRPMINGTRVAIVFPGPRLEASLFRGMRELKG